MKTLREYIDQLDEISRRDFLKGAGATAGLAAIGAPKDAEADWVGPFKDKDPMYDREKTLWFNPSTDNSSELVLVREGTNDYAHIHARNYKFNVGGASYGRLRIDGGPIHIVMFGTIGNQGNEIMMMGDLLKKHPFINPAPLIANAKKQIVVDVSEISTKNYLLFNVQQVKESEIDETASPDAVHRIEQLIQYK